MEDKRKHVVEKSEIRRHDYRYNNDYGGKDDRLATRGPHDVREFPPRIFNIVNESRK